MELNELPKEVTENVELLERFLKKEVTEEEMASLEQWINASPENKALFERVTNPDQQRQLLNEYRHSEEILPQAKNQANVAIFGNQGVVRSIRGIWQKIAGAAAVLLVVAMGAHIWNGQKEEKKPLPQTKQDQATDVSPGKYKAMLTLADGRKVFLDSAATGKLAEQGSARIINRQGQLVYEQGSTSNKEVLYNTLTTSRGQMYPVVLSDNSRIWLNSESSITYPSAFVGHERRVQITGEAYFEIAHDASRPFIVSVNGTEIKVLGTKFNVNAYTDDGPIKTTLLQGSVLVKSGIRQITIMPGQQAQVGNNAINIKYAVDVDAVVAWRYGYFEFNGVDLHALMRTLERWYDIQTVYEGNMQQKFLGDIPRNMNLSQVMDILKGQGIKYKIEGKKITVSPE